MPLETKSHQVIFSVIIVCILVYSTYNQNRILENETSKNRILEKISDKMRQNPQNSLHLHNGFSKEIENIKQSVISESINSESTYSELNIHLKNRPELGLTYHNGTNLLNTVGRYAVIVTNQVTKNDRIQYLFNMPISCISWLEIGYGCFIIMPFFDETEFMINTFVAKTLASFNNKNPTDVVILHSKISDASKVVQFSQVSRLYVSGFLKETAEAELFKNDPGVLDGVYLMTSDVDIAPLSAKIYNINGYDFNVVHPIGFDAIPGKQDIYPALSCIGGYFKYWNFFLENSTEKAFSGDELCLIMKNEEKSIMKEKKVKKIEWYLDQHLAGKNLKKYGDKYGWNRIKTWKSDSQCETW